MTTTKLVKKNGKAYRVESTEIYISENGLVEWGIRFKSGGWNTVWAKNKTEALKKAKAEYNSSENTRVDSVYIMTPETHESLCRSFY